MIEKKTFFICFFIVVMAVGKTTLAAEVRLSDDNAFLYYESRAAVKAPDHKLAEFMSTDYRHAQDEFVKHDLMKKIKPVLHRKLDDAKNDDTVFVRVGTRLGEYDFNKGAFPTGFSETTFIPFDNGYALTFNNGEKAAFIPVAIDRARALSGKLRRSRRATVILHVKLLGVEEKTFNWARKKSINSRITKMEVQLGSGAPVASVAVH